MLDKNPRPRVYIVEGGFDYIKLMYRLGCDGAKGVHDADIVLFTGGEDVDPHLYGEIPLAKTNFNRMRDQKEEQIFKEARAKGIPMVGICRGGQFLNVMNGGKMWQHVSNHALSGTHQMYIEIPPFEAGGHRREIAVTSTHHQMMRPTEEAIILGTADIAYEKDAMGFSLLGKKEPDVEVCFYDDTHCLCFQPHPEYDYAPPECVDFFEECLRDFIYPRVPVPEHIKVLVDAAGKTAVKSKKKGK